MKYQGKPVTVDAFRFLGTEASVIEAQDWVSSHDIENAEVTSQGAKEPFALDVTTAYGIRTIEAGDFLYVLYSALYAASERDFLAQYQETP